MAQNITLLGNSYPDVPSVTLPKTGGGTAQFDDTTDANATASDILSGKTAYVNGSKITGTGSGGGSTPKERKDINFFDYDGTIVESYTTQEWANVSSLPSNPSHTGLTAQGWNYTKAEITTEVTAQGKCDVGQMYVTASGDTEIDIELVDSARLSPALTFAVNGTVTVDWGDGSALDTLTGTSLTSWKKTTPHTYASIGHYTIKIHVVSGSFRPHASGTYYIVSGNSTSGTSNRVFSNSVKAIRIGNNVPGIGNYGLNYCYSLASITIPSSVTSIGNNAFQYCYSLANVTIPKDVASIGSNTFYACYGLEKISIPRTVTSLGNSVFTSCYNLEQITIPSSVTSIGNNAFSSCYSLASITIPSSVTSIGNSTFSNGYSLASITIPSSVTSIGNTAFQNEYGVSEYHIKPTTVPSAGTTIFSGILDDCIIYVPSAKLNDYKTASNWGTYASYMQGE